MWRVENHITEPPEAEDDAAASALLTGFLLQVERIVDKRKNKKGKVEYLVRWRGYGSEGDTWEPESHLSSCMIYVHNFNRQYAEWQRDNTLLRSTRSLPSHHCSPAHRPPFRPPPNTAAGSDISGGLTGDCDQLRPTLGPAYLPPAEPTCPASVSSQQPPLTSSFSLMHACSDNG